MKPLLIVKTGATRPALRARRGDYEDWIAAGLGLGPGRVEVASVFEGDPLPAPEDVSGAVITGSSAMVTDRAGWSERTGVWLRAMVTAGRSVLGICYGHQLLAEVLGGRVARNPLGREMGSIEVALLDGADLDPLFRVCPPTFLAQSTHVESVLELPAGARGLARSPADPHSAFAVGDRAWGVQFHPEFDAEVMRFYLRERREVLVGEGLDPDALLDATDESPQGPALLGRYGELVREAARSQDDAKPGSR